MNTAGDIGRVAGRASAEDLSFGPGMATLADTVHREQSRSHPAGKESNSSDAASDRPHVLFVTNADGFGGTERHLLALLDRLKSKARITILQTGQTPYNHFVPEEQGIRVDTVTLGSPAKWFQCFRSYRPDVVFFVNCWIRSFPCYASAAARAAGAGRVLSIHHLQAPELPPVVGWTPGKLLRRIMGGRVRRRWAFWFSTRFIDSTVAVSDAVRSRLVDDYCHPDAKTRTIYNGVSTQRTLPPAARRQQRAALGYGDEDFVLVCVARLEEVKGIDILLRTVALVQKMTPSVRCLVVGDGPLRESLERQAIELGIAPVATFTGFQKEVAPFLQVSDAFILTSHREGFPLSILEAMACGLPCIATDVGGNREAIRDGVDGFLAPPSDIGALAAAAVRVAGDPELRHKMSQNAARRVAESFQIEDRMGDLVRLTLS